MDNIILGLLSGTLDVLNHTLDGIYFHDGSGGVARCLLDQAVNSIEISNVSAAVGEGCYPVLGFTVLGDWFLRLCHRFLGELLPLGRIGGFRSDRFEVFLFGGSILPFLEFS